MPPQPPRQARKCREGSTKRTRANTAQWRCNIEIAVRVKVIQEGLKEAMEDGARLMQVFIYYAVRARV